MLCGLFLLVFVEGCLAWGPAGHRVTALVAESHLTDKARAAVRELLNGDSLPKVSTWADEIRSDPDWNYAAPWHYVNIEDDETYAKSPKSPGGDVIEAIARMSALLKDPSKPRKQRSEALRFLIHFVGDIHQPLHVGRRSDRGGNGVPVTWFGRDTNLHSVWDSAIIGHWELSYTELAGFLDVPTASQVKQWQQDSVIRWAEEGFAYRSQLYALGDGNLGYEYGHRHGPFLKQRLLQGGVRLAGMLNAIFSK